MTANLRIGIIVGSTRPGRVGAAIADWVHKQTASRTDATYEIVDLEDFNLPVLSEPHMAATGKYTQDGTKSWSAAIDALDGFVIVTPEYNHSTSGALKNAVDHLYAEWINKAAGFVGYGYSDGIRAVEHLRLIMANFQVATVRAQVGFNLGADMTDDTFTPRDHFAGQLDGMLKQLTSWAAAMKSLRDDEQANG